MISARFSLGSWESLWGHSRGDRRQLPWNAAALPGLQSTLDGSEAHTPKARAEPQAAILKNRLGSPRHAEKPANPAASTRTPGVARGRVYDENMIDLIYRTRFLLALFKSLF